MDASDVSDRGPGETGRRGRRRSCVEMAVPAVGVLTVVGNGWDTGLILVLRIEVAREERVVTVEQMLGDHLARAHAPQLVEFGQRFAQVLEIGTEVVL